jgi:hypothetical protein
VPFDYSDIIRHQAQRIQGQRAQAVAELEAARVREDVYALDEASDQILKLDGDLERLGRIANQHVAQNQPQTMPGFENHQRGDAELAAQYRLSPQRYDAATNWTADENVSKKERIEQYLRNEQRYRQMRADGSYRDDQGRVGR